MPRLERLMARLPELFTLILSLTFWPFFSLNDFRPRVRRLARAFLELLSLPAVRSWSEPLASCLHETRTMTTPLRLIFVGEVEALHGLVLMMRSQSDAMSSNVSAAI